MLDPLFELQVLDSSGRSLTAIEIRNGSHAGRRLAITAKNRLTEPLRNCFARYDRIALWIRNAFVSAPMNFTDFDRYRVWLVSGNEVSPIPESLSTTHPEGPYGAPNSFPHDLALSRLPTPARYGGPLPLQDSSRPQGLVIEPFAELKPESRPNPHPRVLGA